MGKDDELLRLMQYLQNEGIIITKDFVRDIRRLVLSDVSTFATQFYKDFARKSFEKYNKFKKLSLTKAQRAKIDGNILWRYEYRNTSNLRCIFIVKEEHNNTNPILLCAFNEDGDKKGGQNAYDHNIDRAINIAQTI